MTKRVFLYATGSDYSAMHFEQTYNMQTFYEDMVRENVKEKIIDLEEEYIEVRMLEFDAVDEHFISFIRHEIMDYDHAKASNFFEVQPIWL